MSKPQIHSYSSTKSTDFHNALDAALNTGMSQPLHRAMWLEQHDRALSAHIPVPLAQHCQLANIRDNQLIYLVDSPLWHSKLRLQQQTLLTRARQQGLTVSRLTIRTVSGQTRHCPVANAQQNSPAPVTLPKGLLEALTILGNA